MSRFRFGGMMPMLVAQAVRSGAHVFPVRDCPVFLRRTVGALDRSIAASPSSATAGPMMVPSAGLVVAEAVMPAPCMLPATLLAEIEAERMPIFPSFFRLAIGAR